VTESRQKPKKALRYRMDRWVRQLVMWAIASLAPEVARAELHPHSSSVNKILLVRANFRMGNAVLALPAIAAFRNNFPEARIDFVGSPISHTLFQHQPLDQHYAAPRRFPQVLWQYPRLIRRLRANQYDLAVDVSCSQSGVGSFIIGLSGARIRAGLAGKWDHLFNLKIAKPRERNKYLKLPELLSALNLEHVESVGSIKFSPAETTEGLAKLESIAGKNNEPLVGVFVGGRKLRGKRWPLEHFVELCQKLRKHGIRTVAFLGPEEKDIADSLRATLDGSVPIVFEPSVRKFAAMISQLTLLVCCDSGPMHLACAAGVRVVAIFQPRNVIGWSPPVTAARVVSGPNGANPAMVFEAALEELSRKTSEENPPSRPVSAGLGRS
jgi:heptosyltransferase III